MTRGTMIHLCAATAYAGARHSAQRSLRYTAGALVVACVLGSATRAAAQEADAVSAEQRAQAAAHMERGQDFFEREQYARAEAEFRRVHELLEGWPTQDLVLVNVARAIESQPGREREAMRIYEQMMRRTDALAADNDNVRQTRQIAEERLAELRARLAARGESEEEDDEHTEDGPATATAPPPAGDSPLVPVGAAIAGVGAVALIGSLATGLLALDAQAELDATCDGFSCPQSSQGLADDAYTFGLATDVLWISGSVLALGGVALLVVGLVTNDDAPPVSAACAGDGCVATFAGRF